MHYVLLGLPGAGKTTIGRKIEKELGIPHLSMRDIVYKEADKINSGVTDRIKEGLPTPENILFNLFEDYFKSNTSFSKAGCFGAFLRTGQYMERLDNFLEENNSYIKQVFNFEADNSVLAARLINRLRCDCGEVYNKKYAPPKKPFICDYCGSGLKANVDDKKEIIEKRISILKPFYKKCLDYYSGNGVLVTIDANKDIDVVYSQIEQLIKP